MKDTFQEIREKIEELEQELRRELAAKQEEFRYTVEKRESGSVVRSRMRTASSPFVGPVMSMSRAFSRF